jgi:structural maintenance of chromosomes protein 5
MARLAVRRTRTPESDDDTDDGSSRAQTPLSTAPNDRKRARLSTRNSNVSSDDDAREGPSQPPLSQALRPGNRLQPATDANHQPGAIVRVKLVNFVTYTKAEFFPGPSLNMVIGPNGTGKSTLVCAICLGLGWGPSLLGRAKEVNEFVKHGAREAFIEIELKRAEPGKVKGLPHRRNPVITRTIVKDGNKSSFTLNGATSSAKAIMAFAQNFNIQIDNLCQFLPQDRVVEFAQMKPHDVLISTQQAAGTPRMVTCYETLLKLRERQKELMGGQRGDREELDNLKRRQEAQRVEVEREKSFREYTQKLEHLQKVKIVPEYLLLKKTSDEAKETQKRLARELVVLKEEVAPTMRKVNAKQAYRSRLVLLKRERDEQVKRAASECQTVEDGIKGLQEDIADYDRLIESDKKTVKPKQIDLRKAQTKLSQLKQRLEEPAPTFDSRAMNEDISDRTREVNDLERDQRITRERLEDLNSQADTRKGVIAEKDAQLKAFDTQAGQRQSVLQNLSRDTAKAWQWIQANRTLFEKPIFGPPAVECTVPNKAMVKAVESILQDSDYRVIIAQTQNDYKMLQQKLVKDLRLHQVSLRLRLEDDLHRYQRPYSEEQLRQFGLDSYVLDHIEGPGTILALLCAEKNLHRSAIAKRRLTSEQHNSLLQSNIAAYYADGQVHNFRRRPELGPDVAMSASHVAKQPKAWTDKPLDLGRKANLQRELAEARGELQQAEEGIQSCNHELQQTRQKINDLKREIDRIREEKSSKQIELTRYNQLPQNIADEESKVAQAQTWLDGARARRDDWEQKKLVVLVDRAEAVIRFADAIRMLKEATTEAIATEVQVIEATSDFEVLEQRSKNIRDMLEQKKTAESQARDEARQMTKRSNEMVKQINELSKEADKELKEKRPALHTLLHRIADEKWAPHDLEAEVESAKASIALAEGGSGDAIRQQEEREKKIAVLEERLGNINKDVEAARAAIEEVREEWEPQLDTLVAKISDTFSDSFARIGCAGQVEVHKANSIAAEDCTEENGGEDNGLDFPNWAIHISVKFRENEPFSLLDSHRQSGGERAVSTIFYLMALQSLARSPFRVVDEINQGMDGRNERMVHGRMVDVATATRADGGQGSQYFLITPKLLSGLKYKRGMTVLCIVSGESVPGEGNATTEEDRDRIGWKRYPRLDFAQLAAKAKSLNLARLSSGPVSRMGTRVDSGVALVGA